MRRTWRLAFALLALLAGATPTSSASGPCSGVLCAGAGKADMTPPVGVPMGGYFARSVVSGPDDWIPQAAQRGPDPNLYAKTFRQSEGIHTPLHARALVVQDRDGRRYAFASLENRGVPYELHQAVAKRLAEAGAGVPAERLLFSSTHSHSAPSPVNPWAAYGLISTDLFDPRAFEIVAGALTEAILEAARNLEPAQVGVGQATLLGVSANRSHAAHLLNTDEPHDPGETPTSPHAIDPTLSVLRAEAASGRPIGAFYAFALHGTTFGDSNPYLSGDNMGPAMRVCERALRERAAALAPTDPGPAPVCAQANGTEGDVAPRADPTGVWITGDFAEAEQTGRQVAAAALRAWDAAAVSADVTLDARFEVLYFLGQEGDPGKPTSPLPMVGVGGNFGNGIGLPFDLPGQGDKVPIGSGLGGYPQWAPLQVIRVGRTALLGVPAEMTVQMGRRLRAAVVTAAPGFLDRAVIVGLANSYVSYVATPEEYAANRYEGAWTLYGPQEGNLIRNELVKLVRDMEAGRRPDYPQAPPYGEALDAAAEETPALLSDGPTLVGAIVAQPAAAERGEVVSFAWVGGNPAADRLRDETFVRLEWFDADGGAWRGVATEDDTFSIVRTDRSSSVGPHRWTARFDLPLDLPLGLYRIRATGRYAHPEGGVAPYEVISNSFEVGPATVIRPQIAISPTGTGHRILVTGAWPKPEGERYALRPTAAAPGFAEVRVIRDGALFTMFTIALDQPTDVAGLAPGDVLRVESGALQDAFGNTNATAAGGVAA